MQNSNVKDKLTTCTELSHNLPVGFHALIECQGGQAFLSIPELEVLMVCAAQASGATVLNTNFHDFGEGQGKTGVVMLAESHITVHTWPEKNYAAFDIFMCGATDIDKAIQVIQASDRSAHVRFQVIQRGPFSSSKSID